MMNNGDILTDTEYHHIIVIWINIVQDVKLYLISCLSLIMGILICVGDVTPSDAKSIEPHLMGVKKHMTVSLHIKKEVLKKSKLAWQQGAYYHHLISVQVVTDLLKLMHTTQTIQNRLKSYGSVGSVMLPFIGKML